MEISFSASFFISQEKIPLSGKFVEMGDFFSIAGEFCEFLGLLCFATKLICQVCGYGSL